VAQRPALEPHELLSGILDGDPVAQGTLWDAYAPLVRGVLRRSLGPSADVDDTLQEVFLTFFRVAKNLRDPEALRPFLIGIAMRMARGELRKRRVRRWFFLSDDGAVPEGATGDDGDAREAVRRLYAILDDLDTESRLAFVLRQIEGLELEEVASALGLSLATTKRRLAKVIPVVDARVRADVVLAPYAQAAPAEARPTILGPRLVTEEGGR
jgi:RNA polymerase sigma-70 factor (ECF subfamily)